MCSTTEEENIAKHKFHSELYKALLNTTNDNQVIELSRKVPDCALHIMTTQNDTILHMVLYFGRCDLALKLLDELPDVYLDKMTRQNRSGNTILHEIAVSKGTLAIVDKVLKKAPTLLGVRNNDGETALFLAARCGEAEIFHFLAGKISAYDMASKDPFLCGGDKSTILHISIVSQNFNLALQIANDYKYLIGRQDMDGMTALQLLSSQPEAFYCEHEDEFFKKIINCVKSICSSALREAAQNEKQKYESAIKLAKFLIEKDFSWEFNNPYRSSIRPKIHKYGDLPSDSAKEKESREDRRNEAEIPLFLATKSGCVDIVKGILQTYPQACGHIDFQGRNILHVAIQYRRLVIFEFLAKEMEINVLKMARKIDNHGNTILHMVGVKRTDYIPEKMEGPALLLQEEVLWFERVKEVSVSYYLDRRNDMGYTAEALFAAANIELRISSKEWLKHTAEGCSVVAVLIATVAFAAAYTVPGGPNEKGLPILMNHPFFLVFTIADILSLAFSLASVVVFLSILTSPFRLHDFKHSLPNKMGLGFSLMFLSVCMMMIAFGATVLLMMKQKESWAKIMLYAFSFIPVGVFSLSYFPLYIRTSTSRAVKYLFKKARQLVPKRFLALLEKIFRFSNGPEARAPSSSIP